MGKVEASQPALHSVLRALRDLVPVLALLVVVGIFTLLDRIYGQGHFFSLLNLFNIVCNNAFITIGALGMMLVIAAGGIDLSAGTMLGLACAVLATTLARWDQAANSSAVTFIAFGVLLLAVLAGGLSGAVNGAIISTFRVAPFIVTLGTMVIFLGIARILAGDTTVSPRHVPDWLGDAVAPFNFRLAYGWLPIIPLGIAIEIVLAIALAFMMRRTIFGRHIIAIGSNEAAARLSGIRVTWVRIAVYSLAGMCFGLAGSMLFPSVTNYTPSMGLGRELDLIAAVVIGGGSLKGGKAPVLGTVVGSLLIAVIRSGCTQIGVSQPWEYIIIGLIIIAAVLFDRAAGRGD
jgi:ribose/xylose/arabinose/galactoside ABC-type transport system permease subunit